jgi:hypothetical protein
MVTGPLAAGDAAAFIRKSMMLGIKVQRNTVSFGP